LEKSTFDWEPILGCVIIIQMRMQHPHEIHEILEDGTVLDVLEQLEVLIAVVIQ
jgi:hypothetical protein